jgi:hypothetical protein
MTLHEHRIGRNVGRSIELEVIVKEGIRVGESHWVFLASDTGSVEGKLHLSRSGDNKLLIFEPGYPGGWSTSLEQKHLPSLVDAGFNVLAIRHSGTIVNGKHSPLYLNCSERQLMGGGVLGDADSTISDWLVEPMAAFDALSGGAGDVYFAGHSFGALAVLNSLATMKLQGRRHLPKIRRFVSLAGTTGRIRSDDDPIIEMWRSRIGAEDIREKIAIGSAEQTIGRLVESYGFVHSHGAMIGDMVDSVFVAVMGKNAEGLDEEILPIEALDIIASMGRGSLVIDTLETAAPGRKAHAMQNLPSDVLIELLEHGVKGNGPTVI